MGLYTKHDERYLSLPKDFPAMYKIGATDEEILTSAKEFYKFCKKIYKDYEEINISFGEESYENGFLPSYKFLYESIGQFISTGEYSKENLLSRFHPRGSTNIIDKRIERVIDDIIKERKEEYTTEASIWHIIFPFLKPFIDAVLAAWKKELRTVLNAHCQTARKGSEEFQLKFNYIYHETGTTLGTYVYFYMAVENDEIHIIYGSGRGNRHEIKFHKNTSDFNKSISTIIFKLTTGLSLNPATRMTQYRYSGPDYKREGKDNG